MRTPITCGATSGSGWPSIAASASMPPTPQPRTPRPLIIVVCESVPTSVSGKAIASPFREAVCTTFARNSRFTWCTIPAPGGTTRKLLNDSWAQRRKGLLGDDMPVEAAEEVLEEHADGEGQTADIGEAKFGKAVEAVVRDGAGGCFERS